jgi:hypothetical protein
MSVSTFRLITGLVLIFHGIGHTLAFIPALNLPSNENWHYRSWLLDGLLGDTTSRVIVIILFGAALIGFITAGLGVFSWLVPHDSWRTLALVSALIGLVALVLFWNAFASFFPNKVGAIAVNLALLWGLLGTNALSNMIADI